MNEYKDNKVMEKESWTDGWAYNWTDNHVIENQAIVRWKIVETNTVLICLPVWLFHCLVGWCF